MRLIFVTAIVFSIGALTVGQQIRRPELQKNQGIEECVKGSRRRVNYGYGELLAAGIYESDEETPVKIGTKLGKEGLEFKVDTEYVVKAKFMVDKFSSFGTQPKYMGIKLSENYIAADQNTQQAYKAIFRQNLLGYHHCSESLKGPLGKNANGCMWLTEDYSDSCPFSEKQEAEIKFRFLVPKLPDAVSETKFRIIGTEEEVIGANGCERLVNPSFPDPIKATAEKDMICFKYTSVFTK